MNPRFDLDSLTGPGLEMFRYLTRWRTVFPKYRFLLSFVSGTHGSRALLEVERCRGSSKEWDIAKVAQSLRFNETRGGVVQGRAA